MNNSRPTTPTNQPTKPASTNAPERPIYNKLTINTPKVEYTCPGCIQSQPNQMAHVVAGGCLEDSFIRLQEDNIKEDHKKEDDNNEETDNTYQCPCYVKGCDGDCGTLWCGCIDVCRGRCGLKDHDYY
jgi:hypothetical protein